MGTRANILRRIGELGLPMDAVLARLDMSVYNTPEEIARQQWLVGQLLYSTSPGYVEIDLEAQQELGVSVLADPVRCRLQDLVMDSGVPARIRAAMVGSMSGDLPGETSRFLIGLVTDDSLAASVRQRALGVLNQRPSWAQPGDAGVYEELARRGGVPPGRRSLAVSAISAATRYQRVRPDPLAGIILEGGDEFPLRDAIHALGPLEGPSGEIVLERLREIALDESLDSGTRLAAIGKISREQGTDAQVALVVELLERRTDPKLAGRLIRVMALNQSLWSRQALITVLVDLEREGGEVGEESGKALQVFAKAKAFTEASEELIRQEREKRLSAP